MEALHNCALWRYGTYVYDVFIGVVSLSCSQVQLQHVSSGYVLCVTAASAERDGSLQCKLEEEGQGGACAFRICPGFRSSIQGDPVMFGQNVLFQCPEMVPNPNAAPRLHTTSFHRALYRSTGYMLVQRIS